MLSLRNRRRHCVKYLAQRSFFTHSCASSHRFGTAQTRQTSEITHYKLFDEQQSGSSPTLSPILPNTQVDCYRWLSYNIVSLFYYVQQQMVSPFHFHQILRLTGRHPSARRSTTTRCLARTHSMSSLKLSPGGSVHRPKAPSAQSQRVSNTQCQYQMLSPLKIDVSLMNDREESKRLSGIRGRA